MQYTHKIDFFSNLVTVRVENEIVESVKEEGFGTCCPRCGEDMVGYWMLRKNPVTGSLEVMCPTANCDNWPVTEIVNKVSK